MSETLDLKFGEKLGFLRPELRSLKRFGVERDGGYVGPTESIANESIILCFGLSRDWSFETEIASQVKNARIYAFDPTVNLKMFVVECLHSFKYIFNSKSDESFYRRARVFGYRLKIIKNYVNEFLLKRNKHIRKWVKGKQPDTKNSIGVADVFKKYGNSTEIVLKVDIEGDEYEVIEEILNLNQIFRVRSIFIEFHIFDSNWQRFFNLVSKIKETHGLVHLHINNGDLSLISEQVPHYLEMSFLRNGVLPPTSEYRESLPLAGIDFSNQTGLPDFNVKFV